MKQQHKGKKSNDTCSCWVCRSEKYRERRREMKKKALDIELNMGSLDDDIIYDINMKATYG